MAATRNKQDASEPSWPAREDLRHLNHDLPRIDGPLKVTGRARYSHDVRLPGMVWGRLYLCPFPSAEIGAIDASKALAIPGVLAVIPLVGEGAAAGSRTRFLGQPVAAVAAETPDLAEDALRALAIEMKEADWVVTREQAIAEDAPLVSERVRIGRSVEQVDENVVNRAITGRQEEAEGVLEQCDAVVEATYSLPVQHHVCLETHGVVVDYRGEGEAKVYASTQGTHALIREAPALLGLPASEVEIIVEHMGGGFGAKFSMGVEGMAACELAKELERPVHLLVKRPDEFLMTGNRSGSRQHLKGGATKDGRFMALVSDVAKLGGFGVGPRPTQPYIYGEALEAYYTESYGVRTNLDSHRAMRAPGHPQLSFGVESMVDELAAAIGFDSLEFRKKNLNEVYGRQLERAAREIGWYEHPHRTGPGAPAEGAEAVGIGFGVSVWGGRGRGRTGVDLGIEPDGSMTVSVGTQDLGTGTRTYVAAIVAEEFGLPIDRVTARIGNSRYPFGYPSGGSATTPTLAPAVKDAAHKARLKFLDHLAEVLEVPVDRLRFEDGVVVDEAGQKLEWEKACATLSGGLSVRGEFQAQLASGGIHGAQAAKVRVDTLTGEIQVEKMVCVQDVGLPLNRMALRSQINGGMIQALSYGLFEERVLDPDLGVMLNANMETYKIAGCQEIPELVAIIDDEDQRQGVIGMAEAVVIPGHSAIANAIFNACGVRLRELPLTADKVLTGLAERA